jgi:L-asparaginase II
VTLPASVVFTRGAIVESAHAVSIAIVDAAGTLIASAGDPERVTFLRSSAKPFQCMTMIETGAADSLALTQPEIAVISASHSGEPRHTEAIGRIMARAGLDLETLQPGRHPPMHAPTREALERRGEAPSVLHHNCSGKHCGMVCACGHQGWDLRTYMRPDHPLQRRNLAVLSEASGVPVSDIPLGIDGCGVPTFALSLRSFATAFARLAQPDRLPAKHHESAIRVRDAMVACPEMVAGEGRFDTDLMRRQGGQVLAKAGAEGCYGVSLLDRGWGLAMKTEDGNARAVAIAVVEALRQIDALNDADVAALAHHARPAVRNYRDEIVGEGRPLFTLERPSG